MHGLSLTYGPSFPDQRVSLDLIKEINSMNWIQALVLRLYKFVCLFCFNFETWVRLELFNNFVVPIYEFFDGGSLLGRLKLCNLVQVKSHELLNLKNVNSICNTYVFCQCFSDLNSSGKRNNHWP